MIKQTRNQRTWAEAGKWIAESNVIFNGTYNSPPHFSRPFWHLPRDRFPVDNLRGAISMGTTQLWAADQPHHYQNIHEFSLPFSLISLSLGLSDISQETDFRWITCEEPSAWAQLNWAADQPNDLDGVQDCAMIMNSGLWNDWNCDRPIQYICEITPKGRATNLCVKTANMPMFSACFESIIIDRWDVVLGYTYIQKKDECFVRAITWMDS